VNSKDYGLSWRVWVANPVALRYYTKVDDLIAFNPNTFAPENVAKAGIFGMEAQAGTRLFGVDINANLSLLDPRNREDGPNGGKLLPRRAQQMASLDLDRRLGKFRIGLSLNQEGRRFDDLANAVRLRGFTTVGLRASYEVYPDVLIEGRADNLFNEHYQTAYLYNQMGTSLFLSLSYRPGSTKP
jgi:vitamin B12 transporter